jgi:hypothetical protein
MLGSLLTKIVGFYPLRFVLGYPLRRQVYKFESATRRCQALQAALLRRILARQADTAFGRDHGFRHMRDLADFRRQVAVAGYERLQPYVDRVRRGEFNALVADRVVHMFAMTSGTTAKRKYIPVTPQYVADYKRTWQIWGVRTWMDHPETRLKPIVQFSGDWDEFRTEAGIPCGAITGLTAQMQKKIVHWLYCMPAAASRIHDTQAKYYTMLRLSLPRKVGMLIAANPSTLINFARFGDQDKEALIRDIHDGTLSDRIVIPPDVRAALAGRLKKNPARARELEAIVRQTGTLLPKDYWRPDRLVIGTWTGGTVGAYVRNFPRYYGAATVRDVGLIASEGRMTIPFADNSSSGILDITSHFFEFLPEEEADSPNPNVLAAHEVQVGKNYFILPTTAYGLYRYHIHDLVRVTGFYNQTPLVEFLSKGSHFANVTGEKVSEYQVAQAMKETCLELSLPAATYSLAPCWDDDQPFYGLFVERSEQTAGDRGQRLAETLERRLRELNSEYAAKRDSLRLNPVRLQLLPPGTWPQWDRQRLTQTGGTPEQYKHPCLINDIHFRDTMPVEREAVSL